MCGCVLRMKSAKTTGTTSKINDFALLSPSVAQCVRAASPGFQGTSSGCKEQGSLSGVGKSLFSLPFLISLLLYLRLWDDAYLCNNTNVVSISHSGSAHLSCLLLPTAHSHCSSSLSCRVLGTREWIWVKNSPANIAFFPLFL